jgi:phosphatidylglycerophosphate synthase
VEKARATGIARYLPNIASGIRIGGAFALPFLMWESWGVTITLPLVGTFTGVPILWLIIYLLLVFTDKVDGTLARRLGAESELGALLDVIGDAALLIIGVLCAIIGFARPSLPAFELSVYLVIVAVIVFGKVLVFIVTKKYFEVGNCLHSYPHKAMATSAYLLVAWWAFIRDVPFWSLLLILVLMVYAVIDEIIYVSRSETYNVDFKGHGFEKYPRRKNAVA